MEGSVTGGVRLLLRLEGLSLLLVGLFAYAEFGGGWGVFALFFFAPDLSFLGYLAGPRVGAASYNSAHSLIGALGVLAAGIFLSVPAAVAAGIIWRLISASTGRSAMASSTLPASGSLTWARSGVGGPAPDSSVRPTPRRGAVNQAFE